MRSASKAKLRSAWRDNGLSIALFALFIVTLAGQILAGWQHHNNERADHDTPPIELRDYLRSGEALSVTMENWESEFLQLFVYVVFTIFLFQRGSSESKDPDNPSEAEEETPVTASSPWPVRRGGWWLKLYQHSLSLTFLVLFLITFTLHALGSVSSYNDERREHGEPTVQLLEYLCSSRFWFESMQNWQSEFLSLWTMVVLSIVLRERGSPESKPVASSHRHTGR
jgi:hypothetical protein